MPTVQNKTPFKPTMAFTLLSLHFTLNANSTSSSLFVKDQMCISSSSWTSRPSKHMILDGIYEWSFWNDIINGSAYYQQYTHKYLYPYIEPNGYRYYIGDGSLDGSSVNALCPINNPPSNYIFNVEDCVGKWYIYDNGWQSDPDMISVNCQDICISNCPYSGLDGTYSWFYFNTTTNSSVYYCNSCQYSPSSSDGAYIYIWLYKYNDGYYYDWRIGPEYKSPYAYVGCSEGYDIHYIAHPDNCSGGWQFYDFNTDDWQNSNTMVKKCNYPTYSTLSPHSKTNTNSKTPNDTVFIIVIVVVAAICVILLLLILHKYCKRKSELREKERLITRYRAKYGSIDQIPQNDDVRP